MVHADLRLEDDRSQSRECLGNRRTGRVCVRRASRMELRGSSSVYVWTGQEHCDWSGCWRITVVCRGPACGELCVEVLAPKSGGDGYLRNVAVTTRACGARAVPPAREKAAAEAAAVRAANRHPDCSTGYGAIALADVLTGHLARAASAANQSASSLRAPARSADAPRQRPGMGGAPERAERRPVP